MTFSDGRLLRFDRDFLTELVVRHKDLISVQCNLDGYQCVYEHLVMEKFTSAYAAAYLTATMAWTHTHDLYTAFCKLVNEQEHELKGIYVIHHLQTNLARFESELNAALSTGRVETKNHNPVAGCSKRTNKRSTRAGSALAPTVSPNDAFKLAVHDRARFYTKYVAESDKSTLEELESSSSSSSSSNDSPFSRLKTNTSTVFWMALEFAKRCRVLSDENRALHQQVEQLLHEGTESSRKRVEEDAQRSKARARSKPTTSKKAAASVVEQPRDVGTMTETLAVETPQVSNASTDTNEKIAFFVVESSEPPSSSDTLVGQGRRRRSFDDLFTKRVRDCYDMSPQAASAYAELLPAKTKTATDQPRKTPKPDTPTQTRQIKSTNHDDAIRTTSHAHETQTIRDTLPAVDDAPKEANGTIHGVAATHTIQYTPLEVCVTQQAQINQLIQNQQIYEHFIRNQQAQFNILNATMHLRLQQFEQAWTFLFRWMAADRFHRR